MNKQESHFGSTLVQAVPVTKRETIVIMSAGGV